MTRLADAGEEALQRIADLPGGQKALTAVNDLRTRVDDLGEEGARDRRARSARREAREGARGAEEGRRRPPAARRRASRPPSRSRERAAAARAGRTSNRAGVVPGCSPSSSIGSGSSASTVTTLPRRSSSRGCGRCVALVGLRQRTNARSRFVTSPIEEHVEEAVVGLGVGARSSSRRRGSGRCATIDVDHPAAARLAVDRDAHLAGLPARRRPRASPSSTRPCRRAPSTISFARCAIAPLDPRARDVREVRARLVARPGAVGRRARGRSSRDVPVQRDVDRARRRRAGCRTCARSPSPCRAGSTASSTSSRADDAVRRPRSPSRRRRRRRAASRRRRPPRAASVASCPGRSRDERVAVEPARGGAVRDLGPALARRAVRRTPG